MVFKPDTWTTPQWLITPPLQWPILIHSTTSTITIRKESDLILVAYTVEFQLDMFAQIHVTGTISGLTNGEIIL